jgi:hypothetical protein
MDASAVAVCIVICCLLWWLHAHLLKALLAPGGVFEAISSGFSAMKVE